MNKRTTARDYPRTARLNTLVREILGDELERMDDERLSLVTLTSVVVDGDLKRAAVYYDHARGDEADDEILTAFEELRPRLQAAIGRQARMRRTPELRFELDGVLRNAERIETLLRSLPEVRGDEPGAGGDGPNVPSDPSAT